jgi:LysR family nitrogen assimilation transcriptional regulator
VNLRQLETFVRVAELGSFSQAARVLGMAQPALSRQVRALEADLRDTLLLRNGRGVVLTGPGAGCSTTVWPCCSWRSAPATS